MRLKRPARPAISLAILILVVWVAAVPPRSWSQTGGIPSPEAKPAADNRERVRLAPAERDMILSEMRTMLESLSGIMQGLVAGNLAMVQKAARVSAVVTAVDPSLEKKLPPGFVQLGRRTHKRFEGLADAINTGATRDAVLRRLAAITASCVTCHATYRVEEMRE